MSAAFMSAAGRARVRGACICRLSGSDGRAICHWDCIIDHGAQRMLDLSDPFVVFVDEDLEYVGDADPSLAILLAMGPARNGWRVLRLERDTDLQAILDRTLAALRVQGCPPEGCDGGMLETGADRPRGLLHSLGILEALRERVAAHHGVEIDPSCIPAAIRIAEPLGGHFPAKAIALLDAAASAAALAGARGPA